VEMPEAGSGAAMVSREAVSASWIYAVSSLRERGYLGK
jgi:hypothetical protein